MTGMTKTEVLVNGDRVFRFYDPRTLPGGVDETDPDGKYIYSCTGANPDMFYLIEEGDRSEKQKMLDASGLEDPEFITTI